MKVNGQRFIIFALTAVSIAFITASLAFAGNDTQAAGNGDWKTGYWVWEASYLPLDPGIPDGRPVDLIYAEAGEYQAPLRDGSPIRLYMGLSDRLPAAESYLAVLRF